ncbi:MAG: hypothetical protein ACJAU1_000277, partial [Psychromonas sp.]
TPFMAHPIVGTMDEYVYTPGDGVVIKGSLRLDVFITRGNSTELSLSLSARKNVLNIGWIKPTRKEKPLCFVRPKSMPVSSVIT